MLWSDVRENGGLSKPRLTVEANVTREMGLEELARPFQVAQQARPSASTCLFLSDHVDLSYRRTMVK